MNILKVLENKDVFEMYAHNFIANRIIQGLREKDIVNIALSGGSTPKNIYNLLGKREDISWNRVNIFLVDERFVPPDDERSNSKLIFDNFPGITFYPVNTTLFDTAEKSAGFYQGTIERHVPEYEFDLISLGLGNDGHTASLFPGTDAVNSEDMLTWGHGAGMDRVTFTFSLINKAKDIVFLIGPGKEDALNSLLGGGDIPATRVRPSVILTHK